jgi:hypothetical protein
VNIDCHGHYTTAPAALWQWDYNRQAMKVVITYCVP